MVLFCADENFNHDIVRGLLRRKPDLDIVSIQEVGLAGAYDRTVLDWAAQNERVLLTHDVTTITKWAYERVRNGQRMPGVFEVARSSPVRTAIEDLVLLAECGREGEWEPKCVTCHCGSAGLNCFPVGRNMTWI